jgi:hypothetical protein
LKTLSSKNRERCPLSLHLFKIVLKVYKEQVSRGTQIEKEGFTNSLEIRSYIENLKIPPKPCKSDRLIQ